jgi:hypothetical protein
LIFSVSSAGSTNLFGAASSASVGLLAVFPLTLLFFTGLYLFVLPYGTKVAQRAAPLTERAAGRTTKGRVAHTRMTRRTEMKMVRIHATNLASSYCETPCLLLREFVTCRASAETLEPRSRGTVSWSTPFDDLRGLQPASDHPSATFRAATRGHANSFRERCVE